MTGPRQGRGDGSPDSPAGSGNYHNSFFTHLFLVPVSLSALVQSAGQHGPRSDSHLLPCKLAAPLRLPLSQELKTPADPGTSAAAQDGACRKHEARIFDVPGRRGSCSSWPDTITPFRGSRKTNLEANVRGLRYFAGAPLLPAHSTRAASISQQAYPSNDRAVFAVVSRFRSDMSGVRMSPPVPVLSS